MEPPHSNFYTPDAGVVGLGAGYLDLGTHALVVDPSSVEVGVPGAEVVIPWLG